MRFWVVNTLALVLGLVGAIAGFTWGGSQPQALFALACGSAGLLFALIAAAMLRRS